MENLTLKESSNSTKIQVFEPETAICTQVESKTAIATVLVGKWIELERVILKAPEIQGRLQSGEEVALMEKMMMRYATLTPKEIGDAMRTAADEAQKGFAANSRAFPKLYLADIEDKCQERAAQKIREAEKKEALQLPKNAGGNIFWGEPSEALAREWPKIAEQTRMMRATINPKMRDRFWFGGSYEQKEASVKVLRQMVSEMHQAGKWDLSQHHYEANAVFATEFYAYFPQFANLTDGMKRPLCPIEVAEIRAKLQRVVPDLSNFPDIEDCKFCAVFDAYWKFKGETTKI